MSNKVEYPPIPHWLFVLSIVGVAVAVAIVRYV